MKRSVSCQPRSVRFLLWKPTWSSCTEMCSRSCSSLLSISDTQPWHLKIFWSVEIMLVQPSDINHDDKTNATINWDSIHRTANFLLTFNCNQFNNKYVSTSSVGLLVISIVSQASYGLPTWITVSECPTSPFSARSRGAWGRHVRSADVSTGSWPGCTSHRTRHTRTDAHAGAPHGSASAFV